MTNRLRRFSKQPWIPVTTQFLVVFNDRSVTCETKTNSSRPTQHETTSASLHKISQSIRILGTVEPITNLQRNSGTSDLANTVKVLPVQSVNAGQVMATLETTLLQAKVTEVQAGLLSSNQALPPDPGEAQTSTQQSGQVRMTSSRNNSSASGQAVHDIKASDQISLRQPQATVSLAQATFTDDQSTVLLGQQNSERCRPVVVPSTRNLRVFSWKASNASHYYQRAGHSCSRARLGSVQDGPKINEKVAVK